MAKDPVEIRRQYLEKQLGPEIASSLSRVDYLRILRAEREGRQVHITALSSGRMKITSSPPPRAATEAPQRNMRFVGPFGLLAAGLSAKTGNRIANPPGHQSLRILQFLFAQRTYERLFLQIAADEREEHSEALVGGRSHKARWIEIRIHFLLLWAAVLWVAVVVGKQFWSIWKLGN